MNSADAILLEGGRTTPNVVRIGDTVRRPVGPHSRFVHRVLDHLAGKGFTAAPTFEGIDADGREMLSFIPGHVPRDLAVFSDDQLAAAARLLRELHDATTDFAAAMADVVCHGDASPCNHVFRNGMPIALIDFDAAHVGPRRDDLGYAAWLWLDLGNASIDARDQGRRLALFFDAYGAPSTDAIAAVVDAQAALATRTSMPEVREWALDCRGRVLRDEPLLEAGLADHVVCAHRPTLRATRHPSPHVRLDCP